MSADANEACGVPDPVGYPGGPRRGWVTALVCGVVPAALIAAMVTVPAVLWSRLPGQVADHWTAAGTANGTASRLTAFLILGLLAIPGIGLVLFGWAATRRGARPARRAAGARALSWAPMIPLGLFIMAISSSAVIMVAVANLGGGGLRSASVGPASLVGILGGPTLLAGPGYLLRRHGGLGAVYGAAPPSSLGLRAGERAVWSGRARASWAWPAGLLLVAAGALVGAVTGQWVPAGVLLAAGVAMLQFVTVRVRVAARGLTVGYGALGLRLTRIPLRRIASAEAVERRQFAFGYRGSLLLFGAAAVIVRPGPALRLTLRDGKTFLVTVDDAATGAALLNDLITAAE